MSQGQDYLRQSDVTALSRWAVVSASSARAKVASGFFICRSCMVQLVLVAHDSFDQPETFLLVQG